MIPWDMGTTPAKTSIVSRMEDIFTQNVAVVLVEAQGVGIIMTLRRKLCNVSQNITRKPNMERDLVIEILLCAADLCEAGEAGSAICYASHDAPWFVWENLSREDSAKIADEHDPQTKRDLCIEAAYRLMGV